MFVRGCVGVYLPGEPCLKCVCVCVGGCYLPPATIHLSVELAGLKVARSKAPKAIHPLSGQRTLSILELKAEFPF